MVTLKSLEREPGPQDAEQVDQGPQAPTHSVVVVAVDVVVLLVVVVVAVVVLLVVVEFELPLERSDVEAEDEEDDDEFEPVACFFERLTPSPRAIAASVRKTRTTRAIVLFFQGESGDVCVCVRGRGGVMVKGVILAQSHHHFRSLPLPLCLSLQLTPERRLLKWSSLLCASIPCLSFHVASPTAIKSGLYVVPVGDVEVAVGAVAEVAVALLERELRASTACPSYRGLAAWCLMA